MQILLRLKKILKSSHLTAFAEQMAAQRFPGYRYRPLTTEEISALERQGNSCEDWSLVQVELQFDPSRVRLSIFSGVVRLPFFYGTVLTPGGISVPTGIYRSTIYDSIIENSHLQDVSHLSGVIVSQGAILQNIGSFVTSGQTCYGVGKRVPIGTEMGGRSIPLIPDCSLDVVQDLLFERKDQEVLSACLQQVETWVQEIQQKICFVGKGAKICNVNILRNSWIGPYARIDGAAKVRNTNISSSLELPTEAFDGVILEGVQIQEGVRIHSYAQVRDSLLMRYAKIGRSAMINCSVIGPCCHVEEAEVTSSFVGPLAQLHHHSLLISTLWPEGRGNVGYGANVGSNHTGRMPDQELWAGLGQFFGLGTCIKFPANFSESPFTLIATGVVSAPQCLRFPFSLIQTPTRVFPGISAHLNEVFPGWGYAHNAFSIVRSLYKYQQRAKGCDENCQYELLNPQLARQTLSAYDVLRGVHVQDYYTEAEIAGLGSNVLRESVRQDAMKAYLAYLERFSVDAALTTLEQTPEMRMNSSLLDVRRLFQGDLMKEISKLIPMVDSIPALVRRHRTLERRWLESFQNGLTRDTQRGRQIFDDYDLVHPVPAELQAWAQQRFEEARRRCNHLLKILRDPIEGA
ncbi:MAG TPA: DUF4954 family protein [Fibrobacteraceae bacterium]|nr:DUF4954 family protein [Fibrobacteraceae bacterium]